MIKYVKNDVSICDSLNKNVSQSWTGVTLTPWYWSRVKQKPHNKATARKQMAAVVVLASATEEESNKIRKQKRYWCKSWLPRRDQYSDMKLLCEL
jgi:hypothetical protein